MNQKLILLSAIISIAIFFKFFIFQNNQFLQSKAIEDPSPLPTAPQILYQEHEIAALIHYDMATYGFNGNLGCNDRNWDKKEAFSSGKLNDPETFNPTKINTDQWAQSVKDLGAKHAILTAKHNCGFLLWPTNATLPGGEEYEFCVGKKRSACKIDIIRSFVNSMDKIQVGHGFYYSLTDNFYLNVKSHLVKNTTLLPGQVKVTQQEFEDIAFQQITELWTNYGNLTEIWFDGGYSSEQKDNVTKLLQKLQSSAACFGGYGVSANPLCWVGTESGHPGGDIWSLGLDGRGDPSSPIFCPKGCDTTLQDLDQWFWGPDIPIRTLSELTKVYHDTVGRNGVMELAFHIDKEGLVPAEHAKRYKEFGDWIRSCYDKSIVETAGQHTNLIVVKIPDNATFDRIVLQENLIYGQNIRNFTLEIKYDHQDWVQVASGSSVGNKRIIVLDKIYKHVLFVKLTVQQYVQTPYIKKFAIYAKCPN